MAENYIYDFKNNTPNHFKYPSIQEYEFTNSDKKAILDKEKNLNKTNHNETIKVELMREFIGELARDRVNEREVNTLPIIEWWD